MGFINRTKFSILPKLGKRARSHSDFLPFSSSSPGFSFCLVTKLKSFPTTSKLSAPLVKDGAHPSETVDHNLMTRSSSRRLESNA